MLERDIRTVLINCDDFLCAAMVNELTRKFWIEAEQKRLEQGLFQIFSQYEYCMWVAFLDYDSELRC